MDQNERNNEIEEYGRGFDLLTAVLAEIPRQAWEFKPAPDEWSVHELVVHMADSEMMGLTRLHKIIAEPGSNLMTYDESKWAEALDYPKQSTEDALQLFRLMRQTTCHLLKILPDQIYTYSVVHPLVVYPEYGKDYTVDKWLKIYARHVRDHNEQLRETLRTWKKRHN